MNYNLKRKIGAAIAAGAIITLAISNVFADVGLAGKVSAKRAQAQDVKCYPDLVACFVQGEAGAKTVCDANGPPQQQPCVCGTVSSCEKSTIGD